MLRLASVALESGSRHGGCRHYSGPGTVPMIARHMMKAVLLLLACTLGNNASAGPAQGWETSELPAALGFLALQCDRRDFCFAIACPDRKLQLVNLAPGGGPFGNPDAGARGRVAALSVGREVFSLSFTWDDSILELARFAGSRSELPVAALTALAVNDGKIEGTNTGPIKATLFSRGLKQRWPGIARACGLPELPR